MNQQNSNLGSEALAEGVIDPALPFSAELLERLKRRRGRIHLFDRFPMERTALVIVDMQNAYVAPGAPMETPAARECVPNINELASVIREAGGTVAWVSMTLASPADWGAYPELMLRPDRVDAVVGCVHPQSPLHALYSGLDVRSEDWQVSKSRFSAFLPGASELGDRLRSAKIDHILIAGTLTNVCCETSGRDAAMQDFRVTMVADANASRTSQEHDAALITFIQSFGDVMTVEEVKQRVRG